MISFHEFLGLKFFFFKFRGFRELTDSNGCFACTLEEECMVRQFCIGGSQWGQKSSNSHGSSSLNIVIEGTIRISIFLQKSEGIMVSKIFKLDQSILTIPK